MLVLSDACTETAETNSVGSVFQENWVIKAKTVDRRSLVFDVARGKAQ